MPELDCPYSVLELQRGASAADIQRAWRHAVFRHHPDRGGEPERFRQALAAYELLRDPERRAKVDAGSLTLATMLAALAELTPDLLAALETLHLATASLVRRRFLDAGLSLLTASFALHRIQQHLKRL